ncbi:uncharacterized protein MONBRDRAFT_23837 [Monosiga brevicollis MX1]|uniref:Exoribonuclease phosphorolytic domain-containing protein n=1 Tax=Monosiga brevicollis TaxID=81824 RepID=A9UUZ6_MONBE|nr:uncharacterized protein MONBRDRAFT_23837 [Monosiga brevicollis MX1]EDQ90996.1 predicted protein [Monosiga brevicollis MX1]|eukprot:XP_001744293.1 hypothetical protein [Monosiga brevicollis MX1]
MCRGVPNLNTFQRSREAGEPRSLALQTGVVSRAAGSCFLEMGRTKVMVACYGPEEAARAGTFSDMGVLECHITRAPFAEQKRATLQETDADRGLRRDLDAMIKPAILLEKYPKSTIALQATILEDDGGVLPALVMASSTALVEAGIELRDIVTAIAGDARMVLALMPSVGEVCGLLHDGKMQLKAQTAATHTLLEAAANYGSALRSTLLEHASA